MKKIFSFLFLFTVVCGSSMFAQQKSYSERNFSFNNFRSLNEKSESEQKIKTLTRSTTAEALGHVVFAIEKFTLGQGYFVEPILVPFYEGESCAHILLNVVGEENCDYSPFPNFYLSAIKDADSGVLNIPQYIYDQCGFDDDYLDSDINDDEWLGEFDYTFMSGWMYFVNNVAAPVGMGAYNPQDGDVIRVQFTLQGYGMDLGSDFMGSGGVAVVANKDELTRMVATINSAENKTELLADAAIKTAYENAYAILEDMTSSQALTNEAAGKLKNALEAFEAGNNPGLPDYQSYWPSFRRDDNNQAIVNTPLAVRERDIQELWKRQIGSGWSSNGAPIIVNDNVYITIGNKIMIIDPETGTIVRESTLAGSVGFFSTIAYGDGMIFVPVGNGVIQAINAETLESLWKTETISSHQTLCQITYKDGLLYTGTVKMGNPNTGYFFCIDVTDEDPSRPDEIKEWKWQSDDTGGYYWSGAVVVGDAVIFGGDSGVLYSCNRLTGERIDSYDIHGENDQSTKTIRCTVSYDEDTQSVYFTGKETQMAYKVPMNADGSFDKDNILTCELAGQATTALVVYNGRAYVTSGTMTSDGGMDIIDVNTMSLISNVNIGGISQASPLLTTAYATAENNYKVYLYITLNNAAGSIVCIEDYEGNNQPFVKFTYQPSTAQYATHSLIADEKGTLYYKNDSGYLFALASGGTPTGTDQMTEERFSVYPNPFTDYIVVSTAAEETVAVYDLSGKCVFSTLSKGNSTWIDTSSFPKGVYMVKCGSEAMKIVK
ncbi:MAG: T9SS type A sorting domain-containing protein [Candidatus Azobacteroides sp.]|nr:T9SS type A sorting domain-containing protein [Candidatus Azobacteroides sp.]